jgi:hypothetical protein
MASKTNRPAKPRVCNYCDEPAISKVQPERGRAFYVCEDHEERGILDSGSGFITPIKP